MSDLLLNNTTNPGTPASAKTKYWTSSSTKRLQFTDDTGVTGPVGAGPSNWINVTQQGTNSIVAGAAAATANVTNLNTIIAAAATGSTIYFPTGIWQFNGVITTLPTDLTFQGEFGGTSIYIIANLAANFITCNASAGYTAFKDMQFFTTVAQTAGAIIETNNGYGVLIERCNFTGNAGGVGTTMFNAISMTGTSSGNGVRISDCVITSFSNVGILAAANSFGQFMVINTILNDTTANGLASIQLLGGGAMQLINCDMFGAQYGLALQPSGTVASVLCVQTYFDTCTTRALICGGAGTVTRCEFSACWFTTGGTASTAIEITTTGAGIHTGLVFRDCTIWNVNATTGTTNGVLVSAVNDLSLTDCVVAGWTTGIQVTPTSPAGTTKLNIVGCTIGAAGSVAANTTGILLNAGAVAYGLINIQANNFSSTTNITDNSTLGTGTAATGIRTIANNAGTTALVTAPLANYAATAIPLTTVTNVDSRGGLLIPASVRTSSGRISIYFTCAATAQTLSPTIRYGTNNSNVDAAAYTPGTALGAGTAALGSASYVVDWEIVNSTTLYVRTKFTNLNNAGTGISSTVSLEQGNGGVTAVATISTAANNWLGVYFSSATAAAITIRSVKYEIQSQ